MLVHQQCSGVLPRGLGTRDLSHMEGLTMPDEPTAAAGGPSGPLTAAGLPIGELPKAYQDVLNSLSEEEIACILSVHQDLKDAGLAPAGPSGWSIGGGIVF
jgi:hypothetical protein